MLRYKFVPGNDRYTHHLQYRKQLLAAAQTSVELQAQIREACRQDVLFFISSFVMQYNPLKEDDRQAGPFIPWDCQARAVLKVPGVPWPGESEDDLDDAGILWCIDNGKSLLIEKSRDMGISWLCLLVFDWRFLFRRLQKFLCISRNEAAVEDDDPDSLFWKLDWVHAHLPGWLCPDIRRRKKFFGNDSLGSTITGQASTGLAGVGGRATAMLIDEFSLIKEDREVRQRTASTTNCRIFNGTHQGMDTEFFILSQQPEIYKLNVHWTQHPDKIAGLYESTQPVKVIDKTYEFPRSFTFIQDGSPLGGPHPGIRSPWYDNKCADIGSARGVSQELDINPSGSVSQFFEVATISELIRHFCTDPQWEGEISFDRNTGQSAQIQREPGGRLRIWAQPDINGRFQPGRYGAGVDIAMGTGASNSCLSIGSADTGEKIASYMHPNLSPDDWAIACYAILHLFKDDAGMPPLTCHEHKGPGILFAKKLQELGFRNFWFEEHLFLLGQRDTPNPGWNPTNMTKLPLLSEYASALRKRQFLNRCETAMKDTLAWHYDKRGQPTYGKRVKAAEDDPSGARDNHGDPTIADALCCRVLLKLGISEQKKVEVETPMGSMAWRRELHYAKARQKTSWVG